MTPAEAIAELAAAFPRTPLNRQQVAIYVREISDLRHDVLAVATGRLLRTSHFMPSIAEIRAAAAEVELGLPDEHQAFEQIVARQAWVREVEKPYQVPFVHPLVKATLDTVGGWRAFDGADSGKVRGTFVKLYREARERAIRDYQTRNHALPAIEPPPRVLS